MQSEIAAHIALDKELEKFKVFRTVFFADMMGSTKYFCQYGDVAGLVQTHKCLDIQAAVAEKHAGIIAKTMGDTLMAYFEEPIDAVHAAIEILKTLAKYNQHQLEEQKIHIRVGLNCGLAILKDRDLFGLMVNIAAKIKSVAMVDEILISSSLEEKISGGQIPLAKDSGRVVKINGEKFEVFKVLWREII